MNDKPETPREGMDEARVESSGMEGMPTGESGGSYGGPPAQGEQYGYGGMSQTPAPPPPYSQAPAEAPLPQYGYTPPQGQPTQYMPPQAPPTQQFGQQGYQQGQPPAYPPANYGGYPPAPQGPVGYGYAQPKDPTMGLLLELLGYVGFLGIGHIWAGKTTRGIAFLVGWWVYLTMSAFLTILLIGCLMLMAAAVVPIASGLFLKSEMEKEQAAMGIRR